MGLYAITSGETYYVKADSREEAEAKYCVALGYYPPEQYPDFDLSTVDEDVEEGETDTIIEYITDLS